jgi:hypothetical protein
MADVKISALGAISAVAGEDLIAIVDDPGVTPASRKATMTQVLAFINSNISALSNIVEDTTPDLGGTLTGSGFDQTGMGTISMTEQAAANADVAGDGQMWVKTATPNQLWFTDDAGTDFELANLTGTQTFTNKTLTSPTLTTPALGTPSALVLTNATGTLTSPTFVTPALGTPASGTLTNCTGLPITGITSSSSSQIATLCSDETGSGSLVFATSPTLVTPVLGTPASGALTNCTALPATQLTAGSMQSGMTIPDPTLTFSINSQTGTTYTPVLADAGKIVTLNNGSAITLTIPPNSSVAYPVGSSLTFISIGAGLTTFAQGSGVTIASAGGTATAPIITAQHNSATAIKIATDTWQVIGALT